MKHARYLFLSAVAVCAAVFTSCQKDVVDPHQPSIPPTHELLDSYAEHLDGVTILSHEVHDIGEVMDLVMGSGMFGDVGPMASQITGMVKSQMHDSLAAWNARFGLHAPDAEVHCVRYLYRTVDHTGAPITLSSYATWAFPKGTDPNEAVLHNRIILFCPFSQTKEDFCATATLGGAASALLTKDALIVSPDPQGFGHDAGHDQMYMNHELVGIQMYDAMAAAYKVFMGEGFSLAGDFFLTLMGMSQGAASSVATQRYMEASELSIDTAMNSLADWWHLAYTYASSGPYSPMITMDEYLSWTTCAHPGVIPLVVKTMVQCYPQTFGGYAEEDCYSERYLAHKLFFDSIYLYKPYTIDEINALLFELVSIPSHQASQPDSMTMVLTDMMSTQMLHPDSALHYKMHECLRRNDLTTGWNPQHPIFITASDIDDYVPYANAEALQRMSPDKVHILTTDHADHATACLFWLLRAFNGAFDSQLEL